MAKKKIIILIIVILSFFAFLHDKQASAGLGIPLTCEATAVVVAIGDGDEEYGGGDLYIRHYVDLAVDSNSAEEVLNEFGWSGGSCRSFYGEREDELIYAYYSYRIAISSPPIAIDGSGAKREDLLVAAIEEKGSVLTSIQPGDIVNVTITYNSDEWDEWYAIDEISKIEPPDLAGPGVSWVYYFFGVVLIVFVYAIIMVLAAKRK